MTVCRPKVKGRLGKYDEIKVLFLCYVAAVVIVCLFLFCMVTLSVTCLPATTTKISQNVTQSGPEVKKV